MVRVLWALLILSLSSWLEASVTAGWKIPIEHFAPDYKTNDKIRKLEKPPGESAFFQPGDELWDLSKGLVCMVPKPCAEDDPFGAQVEVKLDQPWYGDWLVWNARSGMVVASGSWNDIFAAQRLIRFDKAPVTVRTRVEIVTEGKEPLSLDAKATCGEEVSVEEDGLQMDWGAEGWAPSGVVYLRFGISWPGPEKGSQWEVVVSPTLKEGERKRLARHGQGEGSWQLFASAKLEFSNGVPVKEVRWVEKAGSVEVWPVLPFGDPKEGRLGDGLVVWSYRPFSGIHSLMIGGFDPTNLPAIEAPATHADWVRGRAIGLRGYVAANMGVFKDPGSFVVFDPASSRLTFVGTAEDQKAWGENVMPGPYGPGPKLLWIESNPEAGGWGLTCRSGERALITLSKGEEEGSPSFRIEPAMPDESVELSYDFDILKEGKVAGHLKSSAKLELGKPKEITGGAEDGKEEKVVLTVTEN